MFSTESIKTFTGVSVDPILACPIMLTYDVFTIIKVWELCKGESKEERKHSLFCKFFIGIAMCFVTYEES